MPIRAKTSGIYVFVCLAWPPLTRAHDLWLIPPAKASVGNAVAIQANVGMDFPKSEHAPDPAAFAKRLLKRPDGQSGELSPSGQEGHSGLLKFTPDAPGVYVLGVETKPNSIYLDADEFNTYLVSDGLPHIFLLRSKEKS